MVLHLPQKPVLIYLFKIEPVVATSYSLFIVGLTSSIGSVEYFKKGLIHTKTALAFGIPTILSVFITRAYILPSIPSEVFSLGTFLITKRVLIMILFAILMILASYSMIKGRKEQVDDGRKRIEDTEECGCRGESPCSLSG